VLPKKKQHMRAEAAQAVNQDKHINQQKLTNSKELDCKNLIKTKAVQRNKKHAKLEKAWYCI
jgi:hypothetical protein